MYWSGLYSLTLFELLTFNYFIKMYLFGNSCCINTFIPKTTKPTLHFMFVDDIHISADGNMLWILEQKLPSSRNVITGLPLAPGPDMPGISQCNKKNQVILPICGLLFLCYT